MTWQITPAWNADGGERMSFDSKAGTRGRRQPGSAARWFNKLALKRIRGKGGKFMGMNALVLTTIGRKSGAERQTPVGWFPGQDDSWLIVASAGGAAANPAWYFNLAAHPDQVWIEVGGSRYAVTAEQLHGAERDEAWRQITAAAPRFSSYQKGTDRELPIMRLVRRPG
jgi:deazaflavin-dependent oxidoreductase (nitroreductase family)